MLLNCGVGEDSWESLGLQGYPNSPSYRRSVLGVHWKGWCWGWNSNTLATWCEKLTHWKRPWCWERLRAGGEGDDRGWDGWMASSTRWTWVWVDSRSWWWTEGPGELRFMGSQRVGYDSVTELNWTEWLKVFKDHYGCFCMRSVLQGRKGVARRPLKSYYSNLGKRRQWLKLGWLWVVGTVMVESDRISDVTGRSGWARHVAQSITLRRHLMPIYQTHACVLLILMTIKCFYYLKNPHLVIFLRNSLFFSNF